MIFQSGMSDKQNLRVKFYFNRTWCILTQNHVQGKEEQPYFGTPECKNYRTLTL